MDKDLRSINTKVTAFTRGLIPTPGNTLFTILFTSVAIAGLLWANRVGIVLLHAAELTAISTETIAYQGKLANHATEPLDGIYSMTFRLYSAATAGETLWEEQWVSVPVQGGLFHVMLGSITPIPRHIFTANDALYLGITVGTDAEMTPRVQLGSVPYAMRALNISTGGGDIPPGMIAMWSGAPADIPEGWSLCDGTGGTPDLTDRFILSIPDSNAEPGDTGGIHILDLRHTHRVIGMTNREDREVDICYDHGSECEDVVNDNHLHDVDITSRGASSTASPAVDFSAVDIRPKYYTLAFIMKD